MKHLKSVPDVSDAGLGSAAGVEVSRCSVSSSSSCLTMLPLGFSRKGKLRRSPGRTVLACFPTRARPGGLPIMSVCLCSRARPPASVRVGGIAVSASQRGVQAG